MKKHIIIAFISLSVIFFSCTTTFVVTTPQAFKTLPTGYNLQDGHIHITVSFNRSVDQSTVVVGKTFKLKTEKDLNAGGTLEWSADGKTVTFTTTKTFDELNILEAGKNYFFTLTLIGSDDGDGAIKDTDGIHLDGDRNNQNGGNFSTTFLHIG